MKFKRVPWYLRSYKKIIYVVSKVFLKPVDNIFNFTLQEKFKRNLINFHNNNYKINGEYCLIHVPRTGGVTFYRNLLPIFKENLHNFNFPYHPNFNTHNPVNKSADFKKTKYLTVLRDPVERVYSLFIDVLANRKHSLNHLAKKGLEIFCMNSWEVKNMYVRYFSGNIFKDDENHYSKAIGNLNEFYKIFNFHDLEKDIDIFLEKEKNLKNDFKNYKTKKYNKIISDSDREIIKKFNYLDLKLFKKMTKLY